MARPTKQGIDYFPKWNPRPITWNKINSLDYKESIAALRNSSGGFIKNKYVKEAIYKKCAGKCVYCGSKDNLQIDHIVSLYLAVQNKFLLEILNTKDNLQLLCCKCNSSKLPENIK